MAHEFRLYILESEHTDSDSETKRAEAGSDCPFSPSPEEGVTTASKRYQRGDGKLNENIDGGRKAWNNNDRRRRDGLKPTQDSRPGL